MRQIKRSLLFAILVATLVPNWGTGASLADDDHGDHPGGPGHPGDLGEPPDLGERPPQERTTTIRYGPRTVQPAPPNPDGTHGHQHTPGANMGIEKPCNDCYITGMIPNLVDENGNTVGVRDNVMLHHFVMTNQFDGRNDATCAPIGLLAGQRFFASGDERTPAIFAPGVGYYVGNGTWHMGWELMSMSDEPETLSFEIMYLWVPAAEAIGYTDTEPVWLDVAPCLSFFGAPAGPSTKSWTWSANRAGDILGIGGHVHRGGSNLEITNETTGQLVCDSVAGYGETPLYIDHHGEEWVSSMSTCGGPDDPDFDVPVRRGYNVTVTGHYDMPEAVSDQMGIAIAYLTREDCNWFARLLGLC